MRERKNRDGAGDKGNERGEALVGSPALRKPHVQGRRKGNNTERVKQQGREGAEEAEVAPHAANTRCVRRGPSRSLASYAWTSGWSSAER